MCHFLFRRRTFSPSPESTTKTINTVFLLHCDITTMCSTTVFMVTVVVVRMSLAFDVPVICQRFPHNANCPNGGGARRAEPVASRGPGQSFSLSQAQAGQPKTGQPKPGQTQSDPAQPAPSSSGQPAGSSPSKPPDAAEVAQACATLKPQFTAHCIPGATLPADVASYCDLYTERCLQKDGLVPATSSLVPPGQSPYRYSPVDAQPQLVPGGSAWNQLTQLGYQKEQMQQVDYANKWLYDCGNYNLPYNALCYPNGTNFFCNTLRRVCLSHAEDLAAGQTPVNGPFAYNNGLPTGGSGSSRPITRGSNIGIGPFFNMGNNKAVNPLQGVGDSSQLQVPIGGVGATISKGADYGGVIGLNQLGRLLDGRRKRRMIKYLMDRYRRVFVNNRALM